MSNGVSPFHSINDRHLRCRTLLHAWEPVEDDPEVKPAYARTRTTQRQAFQCLRCLSLRYEAWSNVTGDLLWRIYRYAKGYNLPPHSGASRKAMRKEWLSREATATPTRKAS